MDLYAEIGTNNKTLYMDSLTIIPETGEPIRITWDEADHDRKNDTLYVCCHGVYFNNEYANGRIHEMENVKTKEIQFMVAAYNNDVPIDVIPSDELNEDFLLKTLSLSEEENGKSVVCTIVSSDEKIVKQCLNCMLSEYSEQKK